VNVLLREIAKKFSHDVATVKSTFTKAKGLKSLYSEVKSDQIQGEIGSAVT